MPPATAFAPVARPRLAATSFLPADERSRAVLARAVSVAFAIRTDADAQGAHDLDVTAMLLAR
ncbi:hypothetical protein ACI797_08585 [Geodermatophilus sp. SYSU D00691]